MVKEFRKIKKQSKSQIRNTRKRLYARRSLIDEKLSKKKREEAIRDLIKLFHYELPKDFNKISRKGGRKKAINKNVLLKLEYAFAYDMTNEEACILAGIFPSKLYDFLKLYPKFQDTITLLRNIPVLLARKSVVQALVDDPEKAMKYLERKMKLEFSPKLELSHEGGIKYTQDITPEAKEVVDNIFTIFEKKALDVEKEIDTVIYDEDKDDK